MHYTYILKLSNQTYYVGSTKNLPQRLKRHQSNQVKSTANLSPKLAWYCAFPTKLLSEDFEIYLKSSSGTAFRNKHFINKS